MCGLCFVCTCTNTDTDASLDFLEQPFYQYYDTIVTGSKDHQRVINGHSSIAYTTAETQPLNANGQNGINNPIRSYSAELGNSSANNLDAASDDSRNVCSSPFFCCGNKCTLKSNFMPLLDPV